MFFKGDCQLLPWLNPGIYIGVR